MNVECAVWDVERDVERGAGDDCCAHPPIVNITITKQIQLNTTHTYIQLQIQYTYTYQPCWLTNNQTPSLWRGRWGSFDRDPLLQDCLRPCHTQPIHHHVSSLRDSLWGMIWAFWLTCFCQLWIRPFFFPTIKCHTKLLHQGPNTRWSWSSEWELISESILTTSLRSECAFANCTAGDASELFINRAKLLVNCVLSIMPACSHQYHRFIQSWHRRGNYCKFEPRESCEDATVS